MKRDPGGTAAAASLKSSLAKQYLTSHPRPTDSESAF